MRLFFIILNWRDVDSSTRCIESLLENLVPQEDIVFVDNGSADGSVEHISSMFPKITTIAAGKNHGFAGGMNLGASNVMAICNDDDAILFLNNDAKFITNPYNLLHAFQSSDVGLASPLIVSEVNKNNFEFQGSAYDWHKPGIIWYDHETREAKKTNGLIDSPRLSGAALVAKVSTLRKIGLFDDSFFMYFEDDDLSVRSLNAGFRNVIAADVTLVHTGKSSRNAPPHYFFYMKRNEIYFWRKYLSRSVWRWYSFQLYSEGFYNLSDPTYSTEMRDAVKDGLYSGLKNLRGSWSACVRPNWASIFFMFPKLTGKFLRRCSSRLRSLPAEQSKNSARLEI